MIMLTGETAFCPMNGASNVQNQRGALQLPWNATIYMERQDGLKEELVDGTELLHHLLSYLQPWFAGVSSRRQESVLLEAFPWRQWMLS